jgi:type II secretory pathway component GspD/PulD (secretin)
VPFLGDIPVVGWLFKAKKNTKTKKELLIFISPHVLQDIASN